MKPARTPGALPVTSSYKFTAAPLVPVCGAGATVILCKVAAALAAMHPPGVVPKAHELQTSPAAMGPGISSSAMAQPAHPPGCLQQRLCDLRPIGQTVHHDVNLAKVLPH